MLGLLALSVAATGCASGNSAADRDSEDLASTTTTTKTTSTTSTTTIVETTTTLDPGAPLLTDFATAIGERDWEAARPLTTGPAADFALFLEDLQAVQAASGVFAPTPNLVNPRVSPEEFCFNDAVPSDLSLVLGCVTFTAPVIENGALHSFTVDGQDLSDAFVNHEEWGLDTRTCARGRSDTSLEVFFGWTWSWDVKLAGFRVSVISLIDALPNPMPGFSASTELLNAGLVNAGDEGYGLFAPTIAFVADLDRATLPVYLGDRPAEGWMMSNSIGPLRPVSQDELTRLVAWWGEDGAGSPEMVIRIGSKSDTRNLRDDTYGPDVAKYGDFILTSEGSVYCQFVDDKRAETWLSGCDRDWTFDQLARFGADSCIGAVGTVTQFDTITGSCTFLADIAPDEPSLSDDAGLVQIDGGSSTNRCMVDPEVDNEDLFDAVLVSNGTFSYETNLGTNTVPSFVPLMVAELEER